MLLPLFVAALPLGDAALELTYSQDVYQAGQVIELFLTGPAGTSGLVAFDPVPGPLEIPGLGTVGLGLSPDLVFTSFALDATGSALFSCNVPCESPLVGVPRYTQALGVLPEGMLALSNTVVLDVQGECVGCTPGYWKNHPEAWLVTGFDQGQDFDAVFGTDFFQPDVTLGAAAELGGGGVKALARHSVAALLNAASPDVDSPLSVDDVIFLVQCAWIDGTVEEIKNRLEDINESFCPL